MITSSRLPILLIVLGLLWILPAANAESPGSRQVPGETQANDPVYQRMAAARRMAGRSRTMYPSAQLSKESVATGSGGSIQRSTKSIYRGRENVIVIPEADINADAYAATLEDMKVMAHVLDSSLTRYTADQPRIGGVLADFGDFFSSGHETESIYLEGYGAMFLMTVDFPLSPPSGALAEPVDVNGTTIDTTWERARQNVLSPDPYSPTNVGQDRAFDTDRIEEMKKELVRSLKHATNIRYLPADEHIIVRLSSVAEIGVREQTTFQYESRGFSGGGGGGYSGGFGGGFGGSMGMGQVGSSGNHASSPASVLVIRTRKSEVDAFAQGKIDFEAFYRQVTIVMH
ncbi:hypothetical protein ACFL6U_27550 [Planctomycetota bacterium]